MGKLGRTLLLALACVSGNLAAKSTSEIVDHTRQWRQQHELRILTDFRDLLAMPNVSTSTADMHKNADWIEAYLAKRDFTSKRLVAGRAPYIYAERLVSKDLPTILIYAHYDGQPVQVENWTSDPWTPILRTDLVENQGKEQPWPTAGQSIDPNWRIFARSAGDDKAPVIALMAAIDALDQANIPLSVNIKLMLDGEEEVGSPTLNKILANNPELFDVDLMLFCDGPMHQSRQTQLVFGVRGVTGVDLTTFGPSRPLHSGHYGNWAPNPNDLMADLLASLRDEKGNIQVDGYADMVTPATQAELDAIAALPAVDQGLREDLTLHHSEGNGERIEHRLMQPAIVINGIQGGGVGEQARNIIMPTSQASLNLRLVPGQTPENIRAPLEQHFRQQGFHLVYNTPDAKTLMAHKKVLQVNWRDSGYPAFRSALDSKPALALRQILTEARGHAPLLTPTMGGSLPIYLFPDYVKAPIILLPIANHDNNQHGRDENLRLQNLWDAIEIYAAVIAGYQG